MWFSFPSGSTHITVEHQTFGIEVSDENGRSFFRAPDHFAPKILANKGFSMEHPPVTDLKDLPQADPLRDSAIASMAAANEALKLEVQNLRTDCGQFRAQLTASQTENQQLRNLLVQAQGHITLLEEKLEDKPADVTDLPAAEDDDNELDGEIDPNAANAGAATARKGRK